jgi:hypothetical protein
MNPNFYEVKIGTMTRRGDLNATHSFVCQSDKNEYHVRDYYASKYRGFNVRITPVEKIEVVEIKATQPSNCDASIQAATQIKELENKIKMLENLKNKQFDVELKYSEFNGETEALFDDMLEKRNIYYNACTVLDAHIRDRLMTKYYPFARRIETTSRIEGRDNYKGRVELHDAIF